MWGMVASGLGYHLDNFGRWLLGSSPRWGRFYADLLAPNAPKLRTQPGWRFACEYYEQRRWLACRRAALWEAAKAGMSVPLILKWYDGTQVAARLGNDNSLCLYVCGSYEPNEFALLDRVLKPGMVFVDVGANDGLYTLFAARRVGPSGKVLAFEPSTRERINLERNIERNELRNVTVLPVALGRSCGLAELRLAQSSHAGHNTLGRFANDGVKAEGTEQVQLQTLDSLAAERRLGRIDVMKIDVEGAEASVIEGARKVLTATRPLIVLEISDKALRGQGSDAEQLIATLREMNYQIGVFSPTTGRIELHAEGRDLSLNIVAMQPDRIPEVVG
ncbi:MAG: FkbM family methyltransferase [Enhydrobacter sp.]|nr:FkbM family methyltransferase [Enhydrobacter sp.]